MIMSEAQHCDLYRDIRAAFGQQTGTDREVCGALYRGGFITWDTFRVVARRISHGERV